MNLPVLGPLLGASRRAALQSAVASRRVERGPDDESAAYGREHPRELTVLDREDLSLAEEETRLELRRLRASEEVVTLRVDEATAWSQIDTFHSTAVPVLAGAGL